MGTCDGTADSRRTGRLLGHDGSSGGNFTKTAHVGHAKHGPALERRLNDLRRLTPTFTGRVHGRLSGASVSACRATAQWVSLGLGTARQFGRGPRCPWQIPWRLALRLSMRGWASQAAAPHRSPRSPLRRRRSVRGVDAAPAASACGAGAAPRPRAKLATRRVAGRANGEWRMAWCAAAVVVVGAPRGKLSYFVVRSISNRRLSTHLWPC